MARMLWPRKQIPPCFIIKLEVSKSSAESEMLQMFLQKICTVVLSFYRHRSQNPGVNTSIKAAVLYVRFSILRSKGLNDDNYKYNKIVERENFEGKYRTAD